ncbi:SGNH/GDSL hydrolase family protein [Solidesulfovibrio sp.]
MLPLLYVVLGLAALNIAAGFVLSRLRQGRGRTAGMGLLVAVDAVVVILVLLEVFMAFFFIQSDGFNITMASRKWFDRSWQPVNSLGYRDVEPAPRSGDEKIVAVVGDSFVAGHGIDRAEDRFGNVLGQHLGPGWRVVNVAKIGWDTVDEYEALAAYPVTPDVVVLAYFVNDIYRAAEKNGHPLTFAVQFPQGRLAKYLVDHFALANFVYWRLARMGNLDDASLGFWARLRGAYADPVVFAAHARELDAIVSWCRERGVRLVALVIPSLSDVAGSAAMTARVAAYFGGQGVDVLDLTPMLAGQSPGELVVNGVDSHANVRLNARMGELLWQAIAPPHN